MRTDQQKIKMEISRRRRDFNTPSVKLSDSDIQEGVQECPPFKNPRFEMFVLEIDEGVQAVPQFAESASQTPWYLRYPKSL